MTINLDIVAIPGEEIRALDFERLQSIFLGLLAEATVKIRER